MTHGFFITVEGGEGAGKSSMLAFVRDWLTRAGHDVVVTREPGGTELGERVREVLLHARDLQISADAEALLMFAARAEHLQWFAGRAHRPTRSLGAGGVAAEPDVVAGRAGRRGSEARR